MAMNGRLFQQVLGPLDMPGHCPEQWHERVPILSPDLEVGWWCFMQDFSAIMPVHTCNVAFAILQKPYWLAPLAGSRAAVESDHGVLRTCKQIVEEARSW